MTIVNNLSQYYIDIGIKLQVLSIGIKQDNSIFKIDAASREQNKNYEIWILYSNIFASLCRLQK